MSDRRRTLDFTGELSRSNAGAFITPFYFTRPTEAGEVMVFDLRALPGTALAHDMAGAWQTLWAGERWSTRRDARHVSKSAEMIAFVQALHTEGVTRIEDVAGLHIDGFESDLRRRRGRNSAVSYLAYVLRALKLLPVAQLRDDLLVRLQYTSNIQRPKPVPRDAYSEWIADQLRAACRTHISEVIRRLTVEADALVASGSDPREVDPSNHRNGRGKGRTRGWLQPQHLAWELDQAGPMSRATWSERSGYTALPTSLTAVHFALFPRAVDLAPFFLLFLLETGIPVSAVVSLRSDCLRNPRPGLVDIVYYKARGRRSILESVRDGAVFTPGGIIRALLSLTRRLRAHSAGPKGEPMTALWLRLDAMHARACAERFRLDGQRAARHAAPSDPIRCFVRNVGIIGDDGHPMRVIHPARLRKTHKAIWYRRTHGQLEELAYDHTPQVAATRYANIPALQSTHEQTAEDGIRDALALGRTAAVAVLTPEDEVAISAGEAGIGGRLRQPLPILKRVIESAEQDVVLAACADFFNSPFGVPGEPCPVPTWRCLECSNAVVPTRKLPALIAFLDRALSERAELGEDIWRAKFGLACERIEYEILPQYPAPLLAEARAVAASGRVLAWLPLGLFTSMPSGVRP